MQTNYELIVAMNQDGVIGIDQQIPWKHREDMRHFRETTTGHILIMGRKTFDSLPNGRPLNNRIHVVLSNTPEKYDALYRDNDSVFFTRNNRLDDLMQCICNIYPGKHIFVCGGEEIYRILLPRCGKLHITYIDHDISAVTSVSHNYHTITRFPLPIETISKEFREIDAIYLGDSCKKVVYELASPPLNNTFS
jgi:dihydrofolate reductase